LTFVRLAVALGGVVHRMILFAWAAGICLMSASVLVAQETTSPEAQAKIEAGESVYNNNCENCYGDQLVNTGQTFDLRRLTASDRGRFDNSVRNGKNQMPPWKDVLSTEEIDQVWSYIRSKAYQH
jgi:mono/diheme cytochrome c family protein